MRRILSGIRRIFRICITNRATLSPMARGWASIPPILGSLNFPIVVTRVEEIKLVKNKKTRPYVIFREMKTKKGDYFNRITFEKDRVRLYNLDLFEEVAPQEEIVGQGKIRLILNVPEKRTGSISVGVGYSNRQQLIGRAEVSETNFGGRGRLSISSGRQVAQPIATASNSAIPSPGWITSRQRCKSVSMIRSSIVSPTPCKMARLPEQDRAETTTVIMSSAPARP